MIEKMIENGDPIHPIRVDAWRNYYAIPSEEKVTFILMPMEKRMVTYDERVGVAVTYLDATTMEPLKWSQQSAQWNHSGHGEIVTPGYET